MTELICEVKKNGTGNGNKYSDDARLHLAAATNDPDKIKLLLEKRVNVDAQNYFGWTALMVAARNGNMEALLALIEGGANVNMKNRLGMTALHFACGADFLEIAIVLIEMGSIYVMSGDEVLSPLHLSAFSGSDRICNFLLDIGVNANECNHKLNVTPIMLGIASGKNLVVQLLLNRGACIKNMNHARHPNLPTFDASDKMLDVEYQVPNRVESSIGQSRGPQILTDTVKKILDSHRVPGIDTEDGIFNIHRMILSGELASILEKDGLGKFIEVFKNEEVDCEAFLLLNEEDFKCLGINNFLPEIMAAKSNITKLLNKIFP